MGIPALRQKSDPSQQPIACEQCGTKTTVGASHSFVIVYATTGGVPAGIPSFQCPAEQHFACSQECAIALAHACLDGHLVPLHQQHCAAIAAATQSAPIDAKGSATP